MSQSTKRCYKLSDSAALSFVSTHCGLVMTYIFQWSVPQLVQVMGLSSTWWLHQMETFSTLLAICAGNSPVSGEFPAQRPVKQSFDVFFDLNPNKRLSKQWSGWWFETPLCPLCLYRNDHAITMVKLCSLFIHATIWLAKMERSLVRTWSDMICQCIQHSDNNGGTDHLKNKATLNWPTGQHMP